ncbi:MAG: helix-turn-helix domain-containing protein [Candidatus Saccharimonadales bacterium]
MIKNELQYRVKQAALKRFKQTLANHEELLANEEPWVQDLHRAGIRGEIKQLQADIKQYERIKSGDYPGPPLDVVAQIPSMLIQSRIALGWTQEELARRLGVSPQQVQNDEATNYASANLERLIRIAGILQNKTSRQRPGRAEVAKSKSRRRKKNTP